MHLPDTLPFPKAVEYILSRDLFDKKKMLSDALRGHLAPGSGERSKNIISFSQQHITPSKARCQAAFWGFLQVFRRVPSCLPLRGRWQPPSPARRLTEGVPRRGFGPPWASAPTAQTSNPAVGAIHESPADKGLCPAKRAGTSPAPTARAGVSS